MKKWKKYSIFIIYLIACILHFLYDFFPNNFVASFSSVNESIWEHMKLTFNSYLIFSILEYIILKYKKIQVNNYLFSVCASSLTCMLSTLVFFYIFYYIIGHNFILTQTIYLLSMAFASFISYIIITKTNKDLVIDIVSLLSLLFFEFAFIYLTYNPKYEEIFIDRVTNKIGIYDLNISR